MPPVRGTSEAHEPSSHPHLRCLIVDEDASARTSLRSLISERPGAEVVGAAASVAEALVLTESVQYDVVIVSVEMPETGGVEFAERLLGRPGAPAVVFTSVDGRHALEAFDVAAVDYLLKPLDADRLARALARVTARSPAASSTPATGGPAEATRVPVPRGDRTIFVDSADVFVVTASRGDSELKLDDGWVVFGLSLVRFLDRYRGPFVRVHRSHLVNVERIVELRPDGLGGHSVVMGDAARTVVPVSRRQVSMLRERLGM